jgi:acyl dehydratase
LALDPAAVGQSSSPAVFEWDADLAMLYALAVGAGVNDLAHTTDNSDGIPQKVLPTFSVLAAANAFQPQGVLSRIGSFNMAMAVHGDQLVELHAPIPTSGSVTTTDTVTEINDKGSNAAIVLKSHSIATGTGEPLFTTTMTILVRGAGGFGGERGVSVNATPNVGDAHGVVTERTAETQALLYRLTGDKNPLHSDPTFAEKVGFDRPILHGLCTFGYVGRAILASVCGGDDDRFGSLYARLVSPVIPGDELSTAIWTNKSGATFEAQTQDGQVVLDRGVFSFR